MPARASAAAIRAASSASIGHIGAFSFNYYKNMTAGEGGGVVVNDDELAERVALRHRSLPFLLARPERREKPFAGNGARASELMGAMLNVQLDRLDGMIAAMRAREEEDPQGHRAARQSRPDSPRR